MYSFKIRQYLFRQSLNKTLSIFYDDKLGLCYSTLGRKNGWLEPIIIKRDTHPAFYADIDNKDVIHIIFQDKQGNIYYSSLKDENVKTVPILTSKAPSSYNKHMSLLPIGNSLHFLYVLNHNNSVILAHQVMNNGNAATPKVLDYVSYLVQGVVQGDGSRAPLMQGSVQGDGSRAPLVQGSRAPLVQRDGSRAPYSLCSDKSGNIFAFYQTSGRECLQLGYKKYNATQKVWGEFITIKKHNGNCSSPQVISDSKNVIHLCYERQSEGRYDLIYQQKIPDKNIWTPETIIHNSMYPFDKSSVISINDVITVFWVRDDIIYYSSSKDSGSSWSKPTRYYFSAGKHLRCLSYKSNLPYEGERVIAPCIPGSFLNGFRLAFHSECPANPDLPPTDAVKIDTYEEIRILKDEIKALKDSRLANDQLSKLASMHQNLEKEIIKCTLRLGMLENELGQLRNYFRKAAESDAAINDFAAKLDNISREITNLKESTSNVSGDGSIDNVVSGDGS